MTNSKQNLKQNSKQYINLTSSLLSIVLLIIGFVLLAASCTAASTVIQDTSPTELLDFDGNLSYNEEYRVPVNTMHNIVPSTALNVQTADIGTVNIEYTLTKLDGGATFMPNEPIIINDSINGGIIRITAITNTGSSDYTIQASAKGYRTQEQTIKITIEAARVLRVGSYYSEETENYPLNLGQAIEDEASKPFALKATDSILNFSGLMDGSFTIHFGTTADTYNVMLPAQASNAGKLQVLKSDLTENSANSFAFTDGAVIAISGPGLSGTVHVATYHPFNIYSTYDLQAIRHDLDADYVLQNNIEFTNPSDVTTSNFEALGKDDTDDNRFTGTLDGTAAKYSIRAVQIVSSANFQGLFGVIEASAADDTVVQNLVLRDFKILGNDTVGSLAGLIKRGRVEDVSVEVSDSDAATVVARGNTVGGLVGENHGSVSGYASGDVSGNNSVGGLVGTNSNNGTVSGYATGDINGRQRVGGLVGQNFSGTISGHMTGDVTGSRNYIGGLVGQSYSGTISGYMTGMVQGAQYVGGLVGWSIGSITGYTTGDVTGSSDEVGGLVGICNSGTVSGYATGIVKGYGSVGALVGENKGTVSGYSKGTVRGYNVIGGLVGKNRGTVKGYSRSILRRTILQSGTSNLFGFTIGENNTGTDMTYHSVAESLTYDEDGDMAIDATVLTGNHGTAVSITSTTTTTMIESTFTGLTFGTAIGEWTSVAGNWPAINIGDIGLAATASAQPTD